MNAYALICLQESLAKELGVAVGSYTHRANSYHCYEKDFGLLDGFRRRLEQAEEEEDVTYCYEGEWDELMESARGDIARAVEELKNR